ncbi:hypothetical protein A2Z33_00265 [Candidatus Gottesmanbacteria bacterium RBG_16_52_11]|uniref:Uncharacterized protein n=1 Tax=Candidatus Gottesmanbacteria bacterium RBG_16_52_11 TaxID=1798374 RepID=A0A1F5YNI6_9BACT|nr:MAG: hypothetical protein A2Z33_00265 [Candidatus Gottesmanbacteria bacterium RBG_16_52_11]
MRILMILVPGGSEIDADVAVVGGGEPVVGVTVVIQHVHEYVRNGHPREGENLYGLELELLKNQGLAPCTDASDVFCFEARVANLSLANDI